VFHDFVQQLFGRFFAHFLGGWNTVDGVFDLGLKDVDDFSKSRERKDIIVGTISICSRVILCQGSKNLKKRLPSQGIQGQGIQNWYF
jgi:hypothetical protein